MLGSFIIVSALTLSTATAFGIAASAELPKEGAVSSTYSSFGTLKVTAIGKDRPLTVWDENGLSLGNGFSDHMTWHCWGTGDFSNGVGQEQGYCVGTDPAGDQLVDIVSVEKHALGSNSFGGTDTWSGGTGKFAGVGSGGPFVCHSGEFKPATEETYFLHCTAQWSYKLS
jgi:hypothetical protein